MDIIFILSWILLGLIGTHLIIIVFQTDCLMNVDSYEEMWDDLLCPTYRDLVWRLIFSVALGPITIIGLLFEVLVGVIIIIVNLPVWTADFWDKKICDPD